MLMRMPVLAGFVLCSLGLGACGMTDEEAAALSAEIASDMEAAEIDREVAAAQDFDRIAQDAVEGMDTSGLEALTQ